MAWTGAQQVFAVEILLKSCSYTQRFSCSFYITSEWCCSRKKILHSSIDFLSRTASFSRCSDYRFNSLKKKKKTFNSKCRSAPVQAMIAKDCIWKISNEILTRWSYHCHLPEFTRTTQVTVWNVGGISVTLCRIQTWPLAFTKRRNSLEILLVGRVFT